MARFVYYNNNPYGEETEDCVTRAITFASGYTYEEIQDKLYHIGKLLNCNSLCVCCYEFLLTNVLNYTPIHCEGMTLNEFAELYSYGLYLVRSDGHISVLYNFNVLDIWDCRDMVLTNAWKII